MIGHILQDYGDLVARKKEGMGGTAPPTDQVAEVELVMVVG